jgi:glycosyltransferase involved in cell wall biosynthesis
MKLGGLVIHGNNRDTLGACLDSLLAVCDVVVAVDSGSTDGSAELVRERGVRRMEHPWEGYGAARAAGVEALADCDWVFYLDSDERLEPASIEKLRGWKETGSDSEACAVAVRDWAELADGRFLYRTHWRKRLLRIDQARRWSPSMIVHESIEGPKRRRLDVFVEHRFVSAIDQRAWKNDRYALLWAVQACVAGKRRKPAWVQRPAHLWKDAIQGGALFRGGLRGLKLAWLVSRYHAAKYVHLGRLRAGAYPELLEAYRTGSYRELFTRVDRALGA